MSNFNVDFWEKDLQCFSLSHPGNHAPVSDEKAAFVECGLYAMSYGNKDGACQNFIEEGES